MNLQPYRLVVVTPVYEDVAASSRLFSELAREFAGQLFVLAVDDGSVHQPLPLDSLQRAGVAGKVLRLRRNLGHQRAIAVGLAHVAAHLSEQQVVVVMDCDGEDLPGSVPALLQALAAQPLDALVAQRRSRVESWRFKLFYAVYKRLFRLLSGRTLNFGNFMALTPAAVRRLVAMPELPIHLAGSLIAARLRVGTLAVDRGPRYAGQSKMNFVGLALHGFKALMVFAEDVLVRVGIACALIAALAVLGMLAATSLKLLGFSTPGWFSVALGLLLLLFLQTGALALMSLMLSGVVRGGVSLGQADHALLETEGDDGAR